MARTFNMAPEHPLELIPVFRRWKPGIVRDLVYTFIVGLAAWLFFFGLFAHDLPRSRFTAQLWSDFVIATVIAFTIHGLYALGHMVLAPWQHKMRGWLSVTYHVAASTCGVFIGYVISLTLLNPAAVHHTIFTPGVVLSFAIVSMLVSFLLLVLYWMRERELAAKERLAVEQRRVADAERRALEAQLRMLQAQIEPHFLYNTLANVVALIQPAPERARLLLERLIDYLRITLVASRDHDALLQREIDTVAAYLELMKLRMGERLQYRIELAAEAAHLLLPPMLLQPIVENAISHGLEPKVEGGEVVLAARIDQQHLRVTIHDTGVGLRATAPGKVGGGVGLSNLRERIASLYGNNASLRITDNAAGGVSVTLRIPLPSSTPITTA